MSIDTRLRPRTDLESARARVTSNRELRKSNPATAKHMPHADGELAALSWALGAVPTAPLTGHIEVNVSNPVELDRERRVATDMLYGKVPADGRGDAYVSGVESTLMWILGESDSEPF